MTIDDFWTIIEKSRERVTYGFDDSQHGKLHDILKAMDTEEVFFFEQIFDVIHHQAYRWDIWGVAVIIDGGCSDDGFTDFRYGLIAEGRERFENALHDPESIGDWAHSCETPYELFGYVSYKILAERIEKLRTAPGLDEMLAQAVKTYPIKPPHIIKWERKDLPTLFPKVWAKFGEVRR